MDGPDSKGGEVRAQITDRLKRLLAELKTDEGELSQMPDARGGIDFSAGRAALKATIDAAQKLSAALEQSDESAGGSSQNTKGHEQ